MFPTSYRSLRVAAAALAPLLAGCADAGRSTGPGTPAAAIASAPAPAGATHLAIGRAVPLRAVVSASALITTAGGEIALPTAGLRLVFPAGAVSAPVTVSVRTASVGRIAYDFAPHGLKFAAPVRVEQAVGAEAAAGRLPADLVATYVATGYLDSADGAHVADEVIAVTVSTDRRTASFAVSHFSGYQLASGRKKK